MGDSVTISSRTGGYQNLSRFRGELMGLAMLWVMLFHAYPFRFQVRILDEIKSAGFAGVDVFILLSAMGLYVSIRRTGGPLRDFYSVTFTAGGLPGYCPPSGWLWECTACGCGCRAASP